MIRRSIFIALALCLGASAQAATTWTALDLSTLYPGKQVLAYAINDAGQVAGAYLPDSSTFSNRHAFISGPNGGAATTIRAGEAVAINASGQVVGQMFIGGNAFISGPGGVGITEYTPLYSGRPIEAKAVNNAGQMTGDSPGYFIVLGGPNGGAVTNLGPGIGRGINDAGQVAGDLWLDGSGQRTHAFVTDANGANLRDLGTLDNAPGNSNAWAINASGQVVGSSDSANGYQAFLTGANGVGMTGLGTLGSLGSTAFGVNDAGQVVGTITISNYGTYNTRAFITAANGAGMVDLNTLFSLPESAYFTRALDVNNRGQVLAVATNNRFYLLTPTNVPEPSSWALAAFGVCVVVGISARRAKRAASSA